MQPCIVRPTQLYKLHPYTRRPSPQPTDRSLPGAAAPSRPALLPASPQGLNSLLCSLLGGPSRPGPCSPLAVLDLSINGLGDAGCKVGCVEGRRPGGCRRPSKRTTPCRCTLLHLFLASRAGLLVQSPNRNRLWDVALFPSAQDLCRSLPLLGGTGLRVLVLSHNGIGTEGARALAVALPSCTSLQVRHSAPQKLLRSCPAAGSPKAATVPAHAPQIWY